MLRDATYNDPKYLYDRRESSSLGSLSYRVSCHSRIVPSYHVSSTRSYIENVDKHLGISDE